MKPLQLLGIVLTFFNHSAAWSAPTYSARDLQGVWKLTAFVTVDQNGIRHDWCQGAHGTIVYLPSGQMSVSINCQSTMPGSAAAQMGGYLFYAGPYRVNSQTGEVVHHVLNYSDASLQKDLTRKIQIVGNRLRLIGAAANNQKIYIEWVMQESFTHTANPLVGIWELIGSENETPSGVKIPFCTGFYGMIMYTPGGYNAVAINCGPKKDPSAVEPADQFGRKYFYAGSFKIEGKTALHFPTNATDLKVIGAQIDREMKIVGDKLFLAGTNGSKFVAIWKKLGGI